MEFSELVQIVKDAICICEIKIKNDYRKILSEADFERVLSNEIASLLETQKNSERFVVHNQISHYPQEEPNRQNERDSQVDILIAKNDNIDIDAIHHKGVLICGDSIVMELKYIQISESVNRIKEDLNKCGSLLNCEKNNFAFFIVVLLENNNKYEDAEKCIKEYCEANNISNTNLFIRVITKKPLNNE